MTDELTEAARTESTLSKQQETLPYGALLDKQLAPLLADDGSSASFAFVEKTSAQEREEAESVGPGSNPSISSFSAGSLTGASAAISSFFTAKIATSV